MGANHAIATKTPRCCNYHLQGARGGSRGRVSLGPREPRVFEARVSFVFVVSNQEILLFPDKSNKGRCSDLVTSWKWGGGNANFGKFDSFALTKFGIPGGPQVHSLDPSESKLKMKEKWLWLAQSDRDLFRTTVFSLERFLSVWSPGGPCTTRLM